jgi:membrane protein required for colicin V production
MFTAGNFPMHNLYGMNVIDIVLLVIFGWSLISGFFRGFVNQFIALSVLVLAIWASMHFSAFFLDVLSRWIEAKNEYLRIAAFFTCFLAFFLGGLFLGGILEKALKIVLPGILDRLAGSVFSLVKTVFFASLLLVLVHRVDKSSRLIDPDLRADSMLHEPVYSFSLKIFPSLKN